MPLPDPSLYESLSPSWTAPDPPSSISPSSSGPSLSSPPLSSPTTIGVPLGSPLSFLNQPVFQNTRFKMKETGSNSERVLEFCGLAPNNCLRVRDRIKICVVDLGNLACLQPEAIGDLVTPVAGDLAGQIFKVLSFGPEECTLRAPVSRRLRKGETPPRCANSKASSCVSSKQVGSDFLVSHSSFSCHSPYQHSLLDILLVALNND